MLTGAFFLAYAASQIPIGMMLDRIGTRITVSGMLLFAVAGSLLFAAANGMMGLTVARVLMGMGCAGIVSGSLVVCTRWFPPYHFALLVTILVGIGNLGNLVATTPMAAAVQAVGWRFSFVGIAAIVAVLAGLGYLIIRDAPPGHGYHRRKAESLAAVVRGVGEVMLNSRLPVMLGLSFVSYAGMITVLALWGAPYLNDVHGLDVVRRGDVLLIMSTSLVAGQLAFGPLDRIFDTRKGVVLGGGLASVAVLSLLALLPHPALWQVTLLFSALAAFNGYALVAFAHARTIFPDRLVGRGLTTLTVGGMGGPAVMQMVTGPIVGAFTQDDGTVAAEGYRLMFAFLAVTVLAGLLFYSRTSDARPSLEKSATQI